MSNWNRRVAIVGIGRTPARARRTDVNQYEMINEAVREALEDAQLTPQDIDINLIGDMELFQGDYCSDMWHVDGFGGALKPGIRMTTGGTTGGMLVCSATCFVASGMYDLAMAIGWQKHEEGNATTGLVSVDDPLWDGWFSAGVGGGLAAWYLNRYGEGIEMTAAEFRVQAADNASRNPYAHLRNKLTIEDVMSSPVLSYPSRLLHLCPQSSAACCLIFASEERAKRMPNTPVWVKDSVTVHREQAFPEIRYGGNTGSTSTWYKCAEKLYKRNNITDPVKELDLYEMYNPSVWITFDLMESTLRLQEGEFIDMIERGDTARDGAFPICPSGGVITANPIGATAMLRTAEAALQIRGDCGDYQVTKDVNSAISSGFGGSGWYVMHLLTKDLEK